MDMMMTDMMKAMPKMTAMDNGVTMDMTMMQSCVEACSAAAQAATMCADASASEDMARCASMCANTADVATAMMHMMMRPNGYDSAVMMPMMEACMAMGMACSAECMMHADMADHCRICAMACDAMVESCRSMMAAMA
jgi:hypothetical protein